MQDEHNASIYFHKSRTSTSTEACASVQGAKIVIISLTTKQFCFFLSKRHIIEEIREITTSAEGGDNNPALFANNLALLHNNGRVL